MGRAIRVGLKTTGFDDQAERATGNENPNSARDAIVAAATALFARKGYAQTTMSDIAAAISLHQSSLYYWFRSKEQILQTAFDITRAPTEFIGRVAEQPGAPAVKIYRFVRVDTFQVCTVPCDPEEVEQIAERQPEEFAGYWEDRQRLHDLVASLVREAIAQGEFIDCDADLVSIAIVSFDEGIQKRIRYQARHSNRDHHLFVHPSYDPWAAAEFVASTSVRAFLRRPASLERITRLARSYQDLPAPPQSGTEFDRT